MSGAKATTARASAAPYERRLRPTIGAAWMATAAFSSSSMNGAIRFVDQDIHAFEVAFFRNLFGFATLLPLLIRDRFACLRTRKLHLHALRGIFNAAAMLCFFYAVAITPLATIAALGFTSPLFATLFAALFLRERVGPRRIMGLVIGFAGALMILRPGFHQPGLGEVLIFISTIFWGVALVIIKVLARTETSLSITAYMGFFLTPITFAFALMHWSWPGPLDLLILLAIGGFGSLGQYSVAQAFHEADATQVLPLDFTKLIWSSLIGFVFFAEVPDVWTVLGGAVIFTSVVYIAYRETQLARRA